MSKSDKALVEPGAGFFQDCAECGTNQWLITADNNVMGQQIVTLVCKNCGHILNFKVDLVFITSIWGGYYESYRVDISDRKLKWVANTNGRWIPLESRYYRNIEPEEYGRLIDARLSR